MTRKVWIHKLSFKLCRRIGWRVAALLAFGLLLGAGMWESRAAAGSKLALALAQDQDALAIRKKFEEGETLRAQGTEESLRLALKKYEEAIPLCRAIGDRASEGAVFNIIGLVYSALGDSQKALASYNQALTIVRAISNRFGEATTLSNIGAVYRSLGDKQKALGFYNQALPIHREVGDRRGEASTLNNIGLVYDSLGEKQKALDFYNQALPILRAVGDREVEAATLYLLGRVHQSMGQWQKALEFYNQALPIHREVGIREGEGATLNDIGAVYHSVGEWQKALEFYNQALSLSREIGDRREEATALGNIGSVYDSLDEPQKALEFYNQALPLHREVGNRHGESTALNNIGAVYKSLGEWQKALDSFTKALSLRRAVGDRDGEAGTLTNIGAVYDSLGERQKALEYFNQALPLARAGGDRRIEATTLNNIGSVYDSLDEPQKALEFFDQALPMLRAIGDREVEAKTLTNVGSVYKSLGEWQKALEFYNQALAINRAIGDRDGEAAALFNIGQAYDSVGEKQKALDSFTNALSLSRAIGARLVEFGALSGIAYIKSDLGHLDESRSYVESALKIMESLRVNASSKELRASFVATVQTVYEFYIDLLMRMHSREQDKGNDSAALEVSERGRARSLLESLTEARADIKRGVDPELLDREKSLQQSLNAKANQALKLSVNGADESRLATSRREVDALTVELQQVRAEILNTSPRYAALTQPQPLTLAEIQRTLDADTLLLEYSLGAERGFLWAVTPTSINSYVLPKREKVEAAAKRVYELLSKIPNMKGRTAKPGDSRLKEANRRYLEAAAGLSRMLLGPVAGQLGKKRLMIVADGMLHYIPFGALPDPNSLKQGNGNWQPLVVKHEIVNLPSASTLAVLRRELAGRKPAARTLAVLADPIFSEDDERIKPGRRRAVQQTTQPISNPLYDSITRKLVQIAGAESASDDLRIKRLPFTRREAEAIIALAPAGSGMKALDFEASRATATSDQLSQYRYVHFATHGLADGERPELSAIVLSRYDKEGKPQDGFLRAHEVYNLELPAELVTLSACETGLGKLTRGEGLVSLTRGFMYAGAARVVVSLWSVSDRATAELMTKFYRRVLTEGERPAAALRAAQVEMWREKRWEAPYYWAAFMLQGEWR